MSLRVFNCPLANFELLNLCRYDESSEISSQNISYTVSSYDSSSAVTISCQDTDRSNLSTPLPDIEPIHTEKDQKKSKRKKRKSAVNPFLEDDGVVNPFMNYDPPSSQLSVNTSCDQSSTSTLFDESNPYHSSQSQRPDKPKPPPTPTRVSSLKSEVNTAAIKREVVSDVPDVIKEIPKLSDQANDEHLIACADNTDIGNGTPANTKHGEGNPEEQSDDKADTVTLVSSEGLADLEEVDVSNDIVSEVTEIDGAPPATQDSSQGYLSDNNDLRQFLMHLPVHNCQDTNYNPEVMEHKEKSDKGFFSSLKRHFSLSKSSSRSKFKLDRSKSQDINYHVRIEPSEHLRGDDSSDLSPIYRTTALRNQHQRWSFAAPAAPLSVSPPSQYGQYQYYYVLQPSQVYQQLPLKPEQLYQQLAPTMFSYTDPYHDCEPIYHHHTSHLPEPHFSSSSWVSHSPYPQQLSSPFPQELDITSTTQCCTSIPSTGFPQTPPTEYPVSPVHSSPTQEGYSSSPASPPQCQCQCPMCYHNTSDPCQVCGCPHSCSPIQAYHTVGFQRKCQSSENISSVPRTRSRQCQSLGREFISGSLSKPTSLEDFKSMIKKRPEVSRRNLFQSVEKRFSIISEEGDIIASKSSSTYTLKKSETLV